jgi:hypothetical protein
LVELAAMALAVGSSAGRKTNLPVAQTVDVDPVGIRGRPLTWLQSNDVHLPHHASPLTRARGRKAVRAADLVDAALGPMPRQSVATGMQIGFRALTDN